MDERDEMLRDALGGIKTKRVRKIISRYNPSDGIASEIDEGKTYVPGRGIVHVQDVHKKILDCGHPLSLGLGHVAACGHTVCKACADKYGLECAEENCHWKLCTIEGCGCHARFKDGRYYCVEHVLHPLLLLLLNIFDFAKKMIVKIVRLLYSGIMRLGGRR